MNLFKRNKPIEVYEDKSPMWIIHKASDGWVELYHEMLKNDIKHIIYIGDFDNWRTMYEYIIRLRIGDIEIIENLYSENHKHVRLNSFDHSLFTTTTSADFQIVYTWPYYIRPYYIQIGYKFKDNDYDKVDNYRWVAGSYCMDSVCETAFNYIKEGKDNYSSL